jgi:hypothetical protein
MLWTNNDGLVTQMLRLGYDRPRRRRISKKTSTDESSVLAEFDPNRF